MNTMNFFPAVVSCSLLASVSLHSAEAPGFFRDLTFDAALKQAGEQKRIVFVDFFTTWCGPCKMLDRTTWQDDAVAALLREKTIPLKIDAEKETALARRYEIEAYPTLLLVKPDGKVLDRLVGYRNATTFISEFKDALAGKTSLMRAREQAGAAAELDLHSQVQARYKLAQELAQAGHHADALKEYLWLFDDGMQRVASFAGVRGSFLLNSIASLARDYPPALEALRNRRDAAQGRLSADPTNSAAAADLASLNRALKDEQSTLETFDKLPAGSPGRTSLGRFVFDQLLEKRRYADALAAQPIERFRREFDRIASQFWGEGHGQITGEVRQTLQNLELRNAAKEIEALAGAGQLEEARGLIKRVRKLDDSDTTRALLREHLVRAGHGELLEP